jgi:hypothetical protein
MFTGFHCRYFSGFGLLRLGSVVVLQVYTDVSEETGASTLRAEGTMFSTRCWVTCVTLQWMLLIQTSGFYGNLLLNVGVNRHVAKIQRGAMFSSRSYCAKITKRRDDSNFLGHVCWTVTPADVTAKPNTKHSAFCPRIAFVRSVWLFPCTAFTD